jgi:hypothetical protein
VIHTAGEIANSRGYDDSWSSTQLWRSIGNISALINKSLESSVAVLDDSVRQQESDIGPRLTAMPANPGVMTQQSEAGAADGGGGGACYAYCPPMMGFGVCFNMPQGTPPGNCSAVVPLAGAVCPAHGNPRQCQTPPIAEDTACGTIHLNGKPNCTLVGGGCQMMVGAGRGGLLPPNDAFRFTTCMCHPTVFEEKQLTWTSAPCVYSPFMPPSPIPVPVESKR